MIEKDLLLKDDKCKSFLCRLPTSVSLIWDKFLLDIHYNCQQFLTDNIPQAFDIFQK